MLKMSLIDQAAWFARVYQANFGSTQYACISAIQCNIKDFGARYMFLPFVS